MRRARRTILLCPPFRPEPELLWGEISNVAQNGERLRARGKRCGWLRSGEPTIEGVGEGDHEKHRGDRRRDRHTSNTPRVRGQVAEKKRTVKEDSERGKGAIPAISPPFYLDLLPTFVR